MQEDYTELVVEGSFALVKGFLIGFRYGSGNEFNYFFHHKSGIRRDTLAELLKEILDMDNYVHLCLEKNIVDIFKQAVLKAKPLIGIDVKKERQIKEARFNFSFSINNREAAERIKEMLNKLPPGVELEDYQPQEESHPEGEGGTGGYAPLHPYSFKSDGTVKGNFGAVMELFLKAKRMPESELMFLSEIVLGFED